MGIHQGVADEDTVLIMLEDDLLLQDDTSHAISCRWHLAGIKLTNVLVSVRTEIVALILMQTQVEFGSMLNDCVYTLYNITRGLLKKIGAM